MGSRGGPAWRVRREGKWAYQNRRTAAPPSTATTIRVRDGEAVLTDGPYIEGTEIANGFYVITTDDRDSAIRLASQIPASAVQLRQLTGVSGF